MRHQQTILALDPGPRDLGYAVLHARDLLDAGVRTFRFVPTPRRRTQAVQVVRQWIGRFEPVVLVLEATHRNSDPSFQSLWKLTQAIRREASRAHLPCVTYPAQAVRKTLVGNGWASKRDTAVALASLYPALGIYVRQNRQWKERYFQNMFDAVALALHHATRTQ